MLAIWQQLSRRSNWDEIGSIPEDYPDYPPEFAGDVLRAVLWVTKPSCAAWRERNPDYALAVTREEESHEMLPSRRCNQIARRYDLPYCMAVADAIKED